MWFRILGEVLEIEPIAVGRSVREKNRLTKLYGGTRWTKYKGIATVELERGETVQAEVHWYEAHGVGRREIKIKKLLD